MSLRNLARGACRLTIILTCTAANADEARILENLREFFNTGNPVHREQLAKRIAADPEYDRARVSEWLHAAGLFEPMEPGSRRIEIPITEEKTMRVAVRIPAEYDHTRPWPLIYAMHGQGGTGEGIIRYVHYLLGDRVEEFVIAAPDGYHQVSPRWLSAPLPEHARTLLGLKQRIHLDSDRIYATGYSMGGHGSWTMAVVLPDQLAGVMPVAGSLNMPKRDLIDDVLPNLASTRLFVTWGCGDNRMANGKISPTGGIAGTNRAATKRADKMGLPVVWFEDPGRGHSDVVPPPDEVFKLLSYTRVHYPPEIKKTFRALHESSHYWLEADKWVGVALDGKGNIPVVLKDNENAGNPDDVDAAIVRAMRRRVARLEGKIDGQLITVKRKKIHSLTVWIGDGMIDWDQPIEVKVGGRRVYNDQVEPDLLICLLQAARTYDFERLRWAGIRYESRRPGRVVTRRTKFAPMYSD